MSLLPVKRKSGLSEHDPQTHALIIGVGAYDHLPGGPEAKATWDFGLKQLTSSVRSASEMADWLVSKHNNRDAPLGSIALLLSPAVYTPSDDAAPKLGVPIGDQLAVARADQNATRVAFYEWFVRLNKNPDNIGLFFFSGHGLEAGDRYLVPADYGANRADNFDRLLNFTVSHTNMEACQAKTQFYFLDACRQSPPELRNAAALGTVGGYLLGPQPGTRPKRDAPIFHGAVKGGAAAGPPGGVSYFTEALIRCLNGMGARDASGQDCPVNYDSLQRAVREVVFRTGQARPLLGLDCNILPYNDLNPSVDIHLAVPPVQVFALIRCRPAAAHKAALELWLEDASGMRHDAPLPRPEIWRHEIPSGGCVVRVSFAAQDSWADYACPKPFQAVPPLFDPPIFIQPRAP